MAGTSGAGRRGMQIRRIPHSDAQEVAFSKRCSELFKEASELSTLCAVETALVIFSPEGKAFSFGHPSVDSVLNRLVNSSGKPDSDSSQHAQDNDEATLEDLTKRCADLLEELEAARERNDKLKQMLMEHERKTNLLTRPLDELNIEELAMVTSIADELLGKVERKKELLVGPAAPAAISGGESDSSIGDPKGENSSADAHGHNNGQEE